jgi:hypothetical protein
MVHGSSRICPRGRWHHLHWGLVFLLPMVLWACESKAPEPKTKFIGEQTDFSFLVGAMRAIDILFVIDNSPSMDPKQAALAAAFPRMIAALQSLPGGLPDVHIGVVSSDMGAGNGAMGGNCGRVLGDKGLLWGNDPNDLTASVADGSKYATNLIASGCGLNLGARWIEDVQMPSPGVGRQRNYTGNLADVFSCLVKAMGVSGCGEEHQLQATRVALLPQPGINDANNGFLRSEAYLAVVLITDEDDCSANPDNTKNDDMFNMTTKKDPGDTASLRCAARGHLCGGLPIPDYDPAVGYMGTVPFSHAFTDCTAKAQPDPNNPDYAYLPLYDVGEMIDSVRAVKGDLASQKILVSGIIGWPPDPNDLTLSPNVQTSNQYQVGKDATSVPSSQAAMWDYMPLCWDPTQTATDGNIYKAHGGLRLKQFIDAFGANGQTLSICNANFTNALNQIEQLIANATAVALQPGCVSARLVDTDQSTPDITEPECQVQERTPCDTPGAGNCLASGFTQARLPECMDSLGHILDPASLDPSSYTDAEISSVLATTVSDDLRPCWYLAYDRSSTGCPDAFDGQRISILRKAGMTALPGTMIAAQCLTCAAADGTCSSSGNAALPQ